MPAPNTNKQSVIASSRPSYYVGIGASAGGLEALQSFFSKMPADSGMAFIVIQHLSPDYKSFMAELLSRSTKMNVRRVEDGMPIEPNTVYLIVPKKNMIIRHGKLSLSEQPQRPKLNLPIDLFFTSLAEDQGDRSIGVVLSGTGSDGTRGVRSIKEEGGTVLVQLPNSAKFDGMPNSAINTGVADFVTPPEEMPEQLLNFINHPYIASAKDETEDYDGQENNFSRLFTLLNNKFSIDFTHYKPATIIRRIQRRMGIRQVEELDDYLRLLRNESTELDALYKDLLIGVTKFFRDPDSFSTIQSKVIPQLFDQAQKSPSRELRIWIAGCSTGEEAYSIAILLLDYKQKNNISTPVRVFATDIDKRAIEIAGYGHYPESIVADMDVEYLSRYFEKSAPGYQVKRNVREVVVFAVQNLLKDPPFTKVDLITCRNLLIYLQPVLQKKVLSIFNYALRADGFLFLGSSETIGEMSDRFLAVDAKQRIYAHTGEGSLPLKDDFLLPLVRNLGIPDEYRTILAKDMSVPQQNAVDANYYQSIVKKVVDAAIVINNEREVVQSFGDTKKFLSIPEGPMSLDVLSLLPEDLAMAVSSGIHRTRKNQLQMRYSNIRVKSQTHTELVDLTVDILADVRKEGQPLPLFLLQFVSKDTIPQMTEDQASKDEEILVRQRMGDLEQELQFTRENLQATIEELQTSNEELQATNEELLAANEELQSTNEELQSVNEELNTVNAEYQLKNSELSALNDDIRNLMEATDIGTVFLDNELKIRKFTPAIQKSINLLEQDIGRPLKDLALAQFGNLLEEAKTVLASGVYSERIITLKEGWSLLRVLPFMDVDDKISGVVITITKCAQNCPTPKEGPLSIYREAILNCSTPLILTDQDGTILITNQTAEKLIGLSKTQLNNKKFYHPVLNLFWQGSPLSKDISPCMNIDIQKSACRSVEFLHTNGRNCLLDIEASQLTNSKNKHIGTLLHLKKTRKRKQTNNPAE